MYYIIKFGNVLLVDYVYTKFLIKIHYDKMP